MAWLPRRVSFTLCTDQMKILIHVFTGKYTWLGTLVTYAILQIVTEESSTERDFEDEDEKKDEDTAEGSSKAQEPEKIPDSKLVAEVQVSTLYIIISSHSTCCFRNYADSSSPRSKCRCCCAQWTN